MNQSVQLQWRAVCALDDILPDTGVGAFMDGQQIAIFRTADDELYALDNHDPCSGANVLARGLLGSLGDQRVVASPLYKQHFTLMDGRCIEDEACSVRIWPVRLRDGLVELGVAG